jgi:hypothetical protein
MYGDILRLYNVLFDCDIAVWWDPDWTDVRMPEPELDVVNVTASCGTLVESQELPSFDLNLVNSIILTGQDLTEELGNGISTGTFQPTDWPFQTAAGGNYYLPANSPYRHAGMANVDQALLADLARKTTQAPAVYSNLTITANTTLSPQAQCDSTYALDPGYHYDPLDCVLSAVILSNATLTVQPGTVVGVYPDMHGYALTLAAGANIQCLGTAENPVRIPQIKAVQEQPLPIQNRLQDASVMTVFNSPGVLPQGLFRFTKWYAVAQAGRHFHGGSLPTGPIVFKDCEFFGGQVQDYNQPVSFTNCLFARVYTDLEENGDSGFDLSSINNLFRGGTCLLAQMFNSDWVFRNNAFDGTIFENYGGPNPFDHNAYIGTTDYLASTLQTSDVTLDSLAWQSGPLGDFYQPSTSRLLNAGTPTADSLGLYHFTTQTSQVKETNSIVDIGYHYVAVNGTGSPVDTDSDGIPDYLEDANGDGNPVGDATSWRTYDSANGLSAGNRLQVFTPLK